MKPDKGGTTMKLEVSSTAFKEGETIPKQHTGDGKDVSPPLSWSGAPEGTKSFALICDDPDAPGKVWVHWVLFNLPADTSGLKKGAGDAKAGLLPVGAIQSRTDFGAPGYGGPCPPVGHGKHRYIFTVHAISLDKLPLDENSPAAMVGYFLNQNSLGKATLKGVYSR